MRPLFAAIALIAVACGAAPDPQEYEAVLDGLHLPAAWELVHSDLVTPETEPGCSTLIGSCPRAVRFYLDQSDSPSDGYRKAKQTVADAGYAIDREFRPDCDVARSLTPICSFVALKGSDQVQVNVHSPGEDAEGLTIAEEGRVLIRIIAEPR